MLDLNMVAKLVLEGKIYEAEQVLEQYKGIGIIEDIVELLETYITICKKDM